MFIAFGTVLSWSSVSALEGRLDQAGIAWVIGKLNRLGST